MSYWLTRFETDESTDLPMLEAVQDIGTGRVVSPRTPLSSGGAYRLNGTGRSRRHDITITASGQIDGATADEVRIRFEELRNLWGRYGKLHRHVDGSDDDQWVMAEVVEVPTEHTVEHVLWLPVDMQFTIDSPFWHGLRHGTAPLTWDSPGLAWDSGYSWGDVADQYTINTSPKTFTTTNGGNYPVNNPVITLTVASANVTAFRFENTANGTGFEFTGTVTVGNALVVDCGAQSVKNNGVDAYANFEPLLGEWLVFEPGDNEIEITKTGGGTTSTVLLEYSDGWV